MPFVKVAFEKRKKADGESPEGFFSHVQGAYGFLAKSDPAVASSRYSYLGYDPFLLCISRDNVTRLKKRRDFFEWKKSSIEQIFEGEPLEVLRSIFKKVAYKDKPPVPFFGGAFGFFSYDFGASLEGVLLRAFDDLKIPDFVFGFYDKVVAFDHETDEIYFLGLGETDLQAKKKVQELKADLQRPVRLSSDGQTGELTSNLTFSHYEQKIQEIRDFLRNGETYQVNFSQRFSAECTKDPWKIFETMAAHNPAPFSCYFDAVDFQIISASPELLFRKRGNMLETWPIKGTVAREEMPDETGMSRGEDSDRERANELLNSEKEKAELSMIVDLERNDLGKVCVPGSVEILGHREIQTLPHVLHTFSRVRGKLASNHDVFDVIRAMFPGGSITGCPKKRTMEIIDRLEDFRRGVYTGSAGFLTFAGDADFNILIRTVLRKGDKLYLQVGGGVVIESDAKREYDETLAKAKGLLLLNSAKKEG